MIDSKLATELYARSSFAVLGIRLPRKPGRRTFLGLIRHDGPVDILLAVAIAVQFSKHGKCLSPSAFMSELDMIGGPEKGDWQIGWDGNKL